MKSELKAIGTSVGAGHYAIRFYYQFPEGGRDMDMPTWEIPAKSWDHMQLTVAAFNDREEVVWKS